MKTNPAKNNIGIKNGSPKNTANIKKGSNKVRCFSLTTKRILPHIDKITENKIYQLIKDVITFLTSC